MRATAYAALLLLAGASAASATDALLDEALARKALPPDQVQGMVRTTTTVTGGKEPETEVVTVDPRKEPKKGLTSYAQLKEVVGADAHVVDKRAGRTIYAFTTHHVPRAAAHAGEVSVDMDGEDGDETFVGKVEVSMDATGRPYVSHLDLRLDKPSGNLIARIKNIDISYAFSPVANSDAMAATATTVDVSVRALLFMHRTAHAESVLVAAAENDGAKAAR